MLRVPDSTVKGIEPGPEVDPGLFERIDAIRFPHEFSHWSSLTPSMPGFDSHSFERIRYRSVRTAITPALADLSLEISEVQHWSVHSSKIEPGQGTQGAFWHTEHAVDPEEVDPPERWSWIAFNAYGPKILCVDVDGGLSGMPEDIMQYPDLNQLLAEKSDSHIPDEELTLRGGILASLVPGRWHRVNDLVHHRSIKNPTETDIDRSFISVI